MGRIITPLEHEASRRTFLSGGRPGLAYGTRKLEDLKKIKPFPQYEHLVLTKRPSFRDRERMKLWELSAGIGTTSVLASKENAPCRALVSRRRLMQWSAATAAALATDIPAKAMLSLGGSLPPGFLLPGHWMAKQNMIPVYPQPDTTTPTWARHHLAFWDGANTFPYSINLGMAFGGFPYVVVGVGGLPSGMTIGTTYGTANYLNVDWTPSGSFSNTVSFLLMDQQLQTYTYSFALSTAGIWTSGAGQGFLIMDSECGSDFTGTGTWANPWGGNLTDVFGGTYSASMNAHAICVLRGRGSAFPYLPTIYTDQFVGPKNYPIMQMSTTTKPSALIGNPADSSQPFISVGNSNGGSGPCGFGSSTNCNDWFMKDLNFDGYLTGNPNYRLWWAVASNTSRQTFDTILWSNSGFGTSGSTNNATGIFIDPNSSSPANTIFINKMTETNRQPGHPGNSYGICSFYDVQNSLIQNCSIVQDGLTMDNACYCKQDGINVTIRGCVIDVGSTGFTPYAFSYGQNGPLVQQNNETCYCILNSPTTGGAIGVNLASCIPSCQSFDTIWVYRCNVNGQHGIVCNAPSTGGPFNIDANVFQIPGSLPTGASLVYSGNQTASSGLLDAHGNQLSPTGTTGASVQ